ncbi:ABC transporter permease [Micromonospora sp. NPDC050686]|uniref:ABC transporter permease n=1 Tax=Micromonospora sp. NPDC050686 TaxID=3154631 RepID=UPI0033CC2F9F
MGYDEPGRSTTAEPSSGVPATGPEHPLDDRAAEEHGRDRIAVHVCWELVLLVALVVVTLLLWQRDADALRGAALRALAVAVVAYGLLTLAAGVSLRTAAVNLAVGPVAVAAALHFAEQGDRGVVGAAVPALAVAALGGLAVGLVVVVFHVPGWAATLAGAAGVIVYIERRTAPVLVQGEYDPRHSAWYLLAGFAAAAVLGGLFGAIRSIRRLVGRFRPVADPARRRGVGAAVIAVGGLVGSTVLATLAGILLAANGAGPVAPGSGLDWTVLAVGIATLAGTSVYGRRGGVFGTLLAVGLTVVFLAWADARGWTFSRWAVGGVVLGLGLVVTRLIESAGRPATGDVTELAPPHDGSLSGGWSLPQPAPVENWPPAMPTQAVEPPAQWEGPRWESGPGRWDTTDR